MTSLDKVFRPLAVSLLGQFGKAVQYQGQQTSLYNANEGTAENNPIVFTTFAQLSPVGGSSDTTNAALVVGQILTSYMPSVDFESALVNPAAGDQVVIDSEAWTVVSVDPIYSGEQICLYKMTLNFKV
jgi:hypothetical protein